MRPFESVFSSLSGFTVQSKYLPECPAGEVSLSSFSPSEKSSVLSGTNSQDKKGLNESRTVVRPTSDFFSASYFVLFVRKYVLSRVSWLDVAEMSPFSIRSLRRISLLTYTQRYDFTAGSRIIFSVMALMFLSDEHCPEKTPDYSSRS